MKGPQRKNRVWSMKSFRLPPELVDDMEKVMFFTMIGKRPKYRSLNDLVVKAIQQVVKTERRVIEGQGVAWDSLRPGFKQHDMMEEQ